MDCALFDGPAAKRDEGRDKLDGAPALLLAGCAGLGRLFRAGAGLLFRGRAEPGWGVRSARGTPFALAEAGAGR